MRDHPLRKPVEDIERVEGYRNAIEDAFFEFMPGDRLAVATAGAPEVFDRQSLLAVGAAIAILSRDGVGAAAFGAFEHAAQKVLRPLCGIETDRKSTRLNSSH